MQVVSSVTVHTHSLLAADPYEASYAIQAFLFARLITAFGQWGEYLRKSTAFLCIMLVVVASGVGICYFVLGWVSNTVSTVGYTLHTSLTNTKAPVAHKEFISERILSQYDH